MAGGCAAAQVAGGDDPVETLRDAAAVGPNGEEVVFVGAHEPTLVTRGWLQASHRKLDPERIQPYRPYHSHDDIQKIAPGKVIELDIEIWPTSIVCSVGYRLVLTLAGCYFEYGTLGRMLHYDPLDRPEAEFGGLITIHIGSGMASYLLLFHIP